MKKIITSLSSTLLILFASLSLTTVAKSAEFFTIGTGGPTGVYFQTGNAICKMLHKSAIILVDNHIKTNRTSSDLPGQQRDNRAAPGGH